MNDQATVERDRVAPQTVRKVESALARRWARLYGHGPSKVHLGVRADDLLFSFDGGLSPADRFLLERDRGELVRSFRETFVAEVSDQLAEELTKELGLTVTSVAAAFYPTIARTDIYFGVRLDLDGNDDRAAVRAWSRQARRKSRTLGEENRRLGASNDAARRRLEALRESRS